MDQRRLQGGEVHQIINKNILEEIFLYLSPYDLISCELVCKYWQKAITNKIWHHSIDLMFKREILTKINFIIEGKIVKSCYEENAYYKLIKNYDAEYDYKQIYIKFINRKFESITNLYIKQSYTIPLDITYREYLYFRISQIISTPLILFCAFLLTFVDIGNYIRHVYRKKSYHICDCFGCGRHIK